MTTSPPSDYKTAGIFMLISGITTILAAFVWFCLFIVACVGLIYLIPLAAGIFEVISGMALINGKRSSNAKTVSIFGIISALICCNPVGLVLEILAIVKLGTPEVQDYLQE